MRVTLVPCPNTTQSATRSEAKSTAQHEQSTRPSRTLREVTSDAKMVTASTPARSRHASREDVATSSRPPSRDASPQLNATVRYPPPDPLHLFSSGGARDGTSLTAIARQITTSRAPHSVPSSQSSSFVALRPSQAGSTAELAGRAPPRPRRP